MQKRQSTKELFLPSKQNAGKRASGQKEKDRPGRTGRKGPQREEKKRFAGTKSFKGLFCIHRTAEARRKKRCPPFAIKKEGGANKDVLRGKE